MAHTDNRMSCEDLCYSLRLTMLLTHNAIQWIQLNAHTHTKAYILSLSNKIKVHLAFLSVSLHFSHRRTCICILDVGNTSSTNGNALDVQKQYSETITLITSARMHGTPTSDSHLYHRRFRSHGYHTKLLPYDTNINVNTNDNTDSNNIAGLSRVIARSRITTSAYHSP